jgi:hypothetical protein
MISWDSLHWRALRNRFIRRHYRLEIDGMPRDAYWDPRGRFLPIMFQMLVNYVEEEKAGEIHHWSLESAATYQVPAVIVEWLNASRWNRWYHRKRWNRALGLAMLEMEAAMDDPSSPHYSEYAERQAEAARELLAIFRWWTEVRPNRINAFHAFQPPANKFVHEKGGFSDWFIEDEPTERGMTWYKGRAATPEMDAYYKQVGLLEALYDAEDTSMCERLVAARFSLWN